MTDLLELSNVSFRYGSRTVLREVDLDCTEGLVGLLGPNGAGKSTLISVAATLRKPNSGTVRVAGHDVRRRTERVAARRAIGYLPQRFGLVPTMRVRDTVAYAAWVNGMPPDQCMPAAERAMDAVGASDLASSRVRTLSGGQRQRVGIAAAIAHEPTVLFLDEATVGIDPIARVQLRRHLQRVAVGRMVLLATHMVEDVVHLCNRTIVMDHGAIVYDGTVSDLAGTVSEQDRNPLASPLESAYERLLQSRVER